MPALLLFLAPLLAADPPADFFEMKIRPTLATHCLACHRDSAMGGLRLDSRDALLKGGKSGPAIVPGDPDRSLLIQAIEHRHERLKMPPAGERIASGDLRAWIQNGAVWPEGKVIPAARKAFWSFQPVKDSPGESIDSLILARLKKEGLTPLPPADKRTLVRRASYALLGLPPAPDEVDAFLADAAPDAYGKLVDRLLASPRYGERWGRVWLDVARYSDDKLNSTQDEPYPNSHRYRNWVIQALNSDMPYADFIKAQLAGDLMKAGSPETYTPGLGFYALSPEMQDDRVDVTTRGFLGLTVACATCHDHKFDPIPTRDFYALQGVFSNTRLHELPLAPEAEVKAWKVRQEKVDFLEAELRQFYERQTAQLADILAGQTARYLLAARGAGPRDGLDEETLKRWIEYLKAPRQDHPYLREWFAAATPDEIERAARAFEQLVLELNDEKKRIDQRNSVKTLGKAGNDQLAQLELEALEHSKYVLWRGLFERSIRDSAGFFASKEGVYFYGRGKVDRFLSPLWKEHVTALNKRIQAARLEVPVKYPFLQVIRDAEKPADIPIAIRGDRNNKGPIAPRAFLEVLSDGAPKRFTQGAGRLELAEAIADPRNPLTARVIVNRVWAQHFGRGLVASVSNFGQLGDRPSHPELLDLLAARFMANGWSLKWLHREILRSAAFQRQSRLDPGAQTKDPENVLLWRFPRRRADVEMVRDSMLFVSGQMDPEPAGPALKFDEGNRKRTIYGFVSRRRMDPMLALFDFPSPLQTGETRSVTNVPPQRLFLMNSPFVESQAKALAARANGDVRTAFRLALQRSPSAAEMEAATAFLKQGSAVSLARALLASNEFLFLD